MLIQVPTGRDVTAYLLIAGFAVAVFSLYLALIRRMKRRQPDENQVK